MPAGRGSEEKIYEFIERLFDQDCRSVFQALYEEGKELSDEELAQRTGLRLNIVRRSLNMLLEKSLVTYRRVKEPDRFRSEFYWRVNVEGLQQLLLRRKKLVLEKLKTRLRVEKETYYYVCPLDGSRYSLDEAAEYDYICPRCGTPLMPDENQDKIVAVLERIVEKLDEEIKREEGQRR